MEMKLDQQRIRALRLNLSWSQEKLAEAAGLNPRTIQRVEADGSASLHTRLCIARALGVEPAALDNKSTPSAVDQTRAANMRYGRVPVWLQRYGHHLPLLLLITVIYLSWTPIYLSLSASHLPSQGLGGWLLVPTLISYLLLALPWLAIARYRQHGPLRLHLVYLAAILLGMLFRTLQEALAGTVIAWALYFSGLALLYGHYRPGSGLRYVRHAFLVCLATYLVVWLLQVRMGSFVFGAYTRWQAGLDIPRPWISFPRYLLQMLQQATQLFPMALILLFDLGRADQYRDGTGRVDDEAATRLAGAA